MININKNIAQILLFTNIIDYFSYFNNKKLKLIIKIN